MSKMCAGHELLLWHLRRYHGVELCCWLCRLTRDHRLRLRCQHGLLLKLLQLQSRRLLRPRHTRRIDRIFELVGNVRDILCEDRLADEDNLTARTSALELIVKRRPEFAHFSLDDR